MRYFRRFSSFFKQAYSSKWKTRSFSNSRAYLFPVAGFFLSGSLLFLNQPSFQNCEEAESLEDGSQFYVPPGETSDMKIFSGNANWYLANEISTHLGVQLGRATVSRFADGEVHVNIHDNVRGKDIYVIQSLAPPVNENLMELLLIITTLRRASARRITAVIPYFAYGRSTKKAKSGVSPIAAADIAVMLDIAGADRVIAVDLHTSQIQGYFGPAIPVDNLDVSGIAIPYFESKYLKSPVIVSPDANGAGRAKSFRDKLIRHGYDNAKFAVIVDQRKVERERERLKKVVDDVDTELRRFDLNSLELVGEVQGCDCVIYDDMVDSARSITRCAKKLKAAGARRVFAFASHGLFLGKAYERIEKSELLEVVCVNTLPLKAKTTAGVQSWSYCRKVHQLSVAGLLAEAIRSVHKKESVSLLFDD